MLRMESGHLLRGCLTRTTAAALLLTGMLLLGAERAQAGDKIAVGKNWPSAERVSIDAIDHTAWTRLLERYVDERGMVNYAQWKASRGDTAELDAYLQNLSRASLRQPASREATLAYWINAYNAVTVRGILREYPTSSIRNHTARLFGYNIWQDLLLWADGRQFSLHQIEHDALRKSGEPRIHFAIVCASIGCPRLLGEAYTADRLDAQLTANTQQFFADAGKFRYDASQNHLWVSPILDWFAVDFGRDQAAQLRTIAPYLPDEQAKTVARSGTARVSHLDYDWNLNDQASPRQARR
jgi:hypothetical protein